MRMSVVFAIIAAAAATVPAYAQDSKFLMAPVEPPAGYHYEGCEKVGEANGKPVMGGRNCRFERNGGQQAERQPPRGYDQPARAEPYEDEGDDEPRYQQPSAYDSWVVEMKRYCATYYWAPACRSQSSEPSYGRQATNSVIVVPFGFHRHSQPQSQPQPHFAWPHRGAFAGSHRAFEHRGPFGNAPRGGGWSHHHHRH